MNYISICTDLTQLAIDFPELFDAEASDHKRGKLKGWSGDHTVYNGNMSMKCLTSIEGLDEIAEKDYIRVTSYEKIHGYRRQVEIDGVPQFGEPITTVTPAFTPSVITGYEDDLTRPIYVVERIETPTTRTVTDEDGNEQEVAGRPIVEYVTTDEIEGYKQVPVYGDGEEVPEQTYTVKHPVLEDVPGNAELKALYDEIYPRTPVVDDEGNVHTPPPLFAVPGGHDASRILV